MPASRTLIDFINPHDATAAPERLAFGEPDRKLVARTADEVISVLAQAQACAEAGLWCVGYVRYEAAPAFDVALTVHEPHGADGPLAWFGIHRAPLADDAAWHALTPEPHVQWEATLDRSAFDAGMAAIHESIASGEFYQVNYTAPVVAPFDGATLPWFHALRRAQPRAYSAFIDTGDEQVLSVSPELFFDWKDGHLLGRPMKGTAPRGSTPEDDVAQAQYLRSSPKEQAENVMIVDLIRNDLSRVAEPFSVKVPRLFHLEALPTVWQMTSDVTAQSRKGTSLVDVFKALFPCGSITGAPKVQAMRKLRALEPVPRGVYCGAVGIVRPGGHATFNVAIRTVVVQGKAARCGIGSGITADAQPDGEWAEWQSKRRFLERASQPFELLETLALRDGQWRNLDEHLQRIAGAAQHFGFVYSPDTVRSSLGALQNAHPRGAWRVRLLLQPSGHCTCQAFALADTPEPVRLQLATRPMDEAHSEFVRFKTTRRAHYDAFTPANSQVFDTILWNARGELTECTRGNIALQLDGQWVTPPLACGLLAGVGRAVLLREGVLQERVLKVEDLQRAQGLMFLNSLRGGLAAQWVE
ncbi:MAG: aminodeoxychorismate synthase component I [Rhodoferax sp.]|nr:aminodeoxychorismate synthase component I [Rhodoferax sp.]